MTVKWLQLKGETIIKIIIHFYVKNHRDFPGGPVAKTPRSQCRGPGVRSLVRELYPTRLRVTKPVHHDC